MEFAQFSLSFEPTRRQYSVGELTAEISQLLTDAYSNIWVSGEISGLKLAGSGHAYFTLKDDRASIRCACWKNCYRLLRFKPRDGIEVLARGRIEVYEPRGEYQFIVEAIEPVGSGALQLAFEQLKKKLTAEGLFEAGRKRPLPRMPRRIGIVTSPSGAVIRDILHVLERRFPGLHIQVYPALVQGAGSAEQVIAGLRHFNTGGWADVVIVARGGGSIEDLWTFNEEAVVRAIAASTVPVISAIGHETDFTLADFVADLRAPTPSAAAEIVSAARETVFDQVCSGRSRVIQAMRLRLSQTARRLETAGSQRAQMNIERRLRRSGQRVDDAESAARQAIGIRLRRSRARWQVGEMRLRRLDLRLKFRDARFRVEHAQERLRSAMRVRMERLESDHALLAAKLHQLNPLAILERGYAVVTLPDGSILRSPAAAPAGTRLRLRLAQGDKTATAE